MAITRRQFVTRLGTLAAATGLSQSQLFKLAEAMGHGGVANSAKPKVIWVHGAECTGCSTSLLGLFEDVRGLAVEDTRLTASLADPATGVSTLAALDLVVGGDGSGATTLSQGGLDALGISATAVHAGNGHRTLWENGADFDGAANPIVGGALDGVPNPYIANIADVLIDFIDLQYHETVMSMGGDLAYQWLASEMYDAEDGTKFILVVEGAVQVEDEGGAWNKAGDAPWCAIGMDETPHANYGTSSNGGEHKFDDVVKLLSARNDCLAVVAIGQCAAFGGYPACVSPNAQFGGKSQTPAFGVYDYLLKKSGLANAVDVSNKVVNVPGCPTNPWWFVLTTVLFLAEAVNGPLKTTPTAGPLGILNASTQIVGGVDSQRRLQAVYGMPIHGPACPRYKYSFSWKNDAGVLQPPLYAQKPGDPGCLAVLGCKGLSTNSLCSLHGWNAQQPHNDSSWDEGLADQQGAYSGGFCVTGGAPCMGCTERGYPDAYVPFIAKR